MTSTTDLGQVLALSDEAQDLLTIVNIGRPAEGAWSGRSPRLDDEEAVSAV